MTENHDHAIRRDGQRQYKRQVDGRYSWDHRMPAPPRSEKPLSRQQRRQEEREARKEQDKALRQRARVDGAVRRVEDHQTRSRS